MIPPAVECKATAGTRLPSLLHHAAPCCTQPHPSAPNGPQLPPTVPNCTLLSLQSFPLPSRPPLSRILYLVFPHFHPHTTRNGLALASVTSTNSVCRLGAPPSSLPLPPDPLPPPPPPRSAGVCSHPPASKKAETTCITGPPHTPTDSIHTYVHTYIHTAHTKRPGHLCSSPLCSICLAAGVCTACPPLTAARKRGLTGPTALPFKY